MQYASVKLSVALDSVFLTTEGAEGFLRALCVSSSAPSVVKKNTY